MGRTFEVLTGLRKAAGAESAAAVPLRVAPKPLVAEPELADGPTLVPVTSDDLPGDQADVPHVEVGGPRAKASMGPQLVPPRSVPAVPVADLAFHLLTDSGRPTLPPPPDLISYQRPEHPTARQYRRLADAIAVQHPGGRPPVLLFTPASATMSGTSTVANLAVTRAVDGLGRVLVIDVESRPGSAAERFGVPPAPGLRELLSRTVPVGVALHRTGVEGVYLVPAGKADVGTDEAARLPGLLDQFRGRFDWVFVDGPVWGTFPLNEWAKCGDGVYLILRPEEWDSPLADSAAEGIARVGGRLRGCITTQEAPPSPAVLPMSFPEPKTNSADVDVGGNQVVDHVVPPVGVARRRLRAPGVVRRPGDE